MTSSAPSDFLVKLTPTISVMQSTLRADFSALHGARHWKDSIFSPVECDLARALDLALGKPGSIAVVRERLCGIALSAIREALSIK